MDTKHRHELEQNDLQEFFTHFGEWWGKWGNHVLAVLVVIAVAVLGWRFFSARAAESHEKLWSDVNASTDPASLRQIAEENAGKPVAALAYLRSGDLLLAKATFRDQASDMPPTASAPAPVSEAEREAWIKDAGAAYEQAIATPSAQPVVRLNAQLGLAAVNEARSDWAGARKLYQQVQQGAGNTFPIIAADAKAREGLLDRLNAPLAFSPEVPPPTTPGSEFPSTRPAPQIPASQRSPGVRPAASSQPTP